MGECRGVEGRGVRSGLLSQPSYIEGAAWIQG